MERRALSTLALTIIMAVLALAAPASFAQINVGDRDPTFPSPTLLNGAGAGTVKAMVHTPSGTIIVGDFTSVNGVPRGRIARLLPNGSLDPEFATGEGADGAINAVALVGSHYVLGGEFTHFDGSLRTYLARVSAVTGRLDGTYATNGPNGVVHAIVAFGSGCFIGGEFTSVGGRNRSRLAHLGATGVADSTVYNSFGANGPVYALAAPGSPTSNEQLFVGGAFTSLAGQPRNGLAAINLWRRSLDPFNANAAGPNGPVLTILAANSGYYDGGVLYIGGAFSAVNGIGRGNIARYVVGNGYSYPYNGTSELDATFNVFTDGPVRQILQVNSLGLSQLLVGGDFLHVNGTPKRHLARLVSAPINYGYFWPPMTFNLDMTFGSGAGPDAPVRTVATTMDGKVMIGGSFGNVSGAAAPAIVRLYGSGGSAPPAVPTIRAAFAAGATRCYIEWGSVSYTSHYSLERRVEGEVDWVPFTVPTTKRVDLNLQPSTTYHYRLRSVSSNGSSEPSPSVAVTTLAEEWTGAGALDPAFTAPIQPFPGISSASLLRDGRILIAGRFSTLLGVPRAGVAVLLPDLTLDPSFDPGISPSSSPEEAIALPDGGFLIRGQI